MNWDETTDVYKHEVAMDCAPVHCHTHGVDEPGPGFIYCYECGHMYRTAGELRRAYRKIIWKMYRDEYPAWVLIFFIGLKLKRAKKIFFCQECMHDF